MILWVLEVELYVIDKQIRIFKVLDLALRYSTSIKRITSKRRQTRLKRLCPSAHLITIMMIANDAPLNFFGGAILKVSGELA